MCAWSTDDIHCNKREMYVMSELFIDDTLIANGMN